MVPASVIDLSHARAGARQVLQNGTSDADGHSFAQQALQPC